MNSCVQSIATLASRIAPLLRVFVCGSLLVALRYLRIRECRKEATFHVLSFHDKTTEGRPSISSGYRIDRKDARSSPRTFCRFR